MMHIFFDLSGLLRRSRIQTPTGIERVVLMYSRYLREKRREQVSFVFKIRDTLRLVQRPAAEGFLDIVDALWTHGPNANGYDGALTRIGRFLGDQQVKVNSPYRLPRGDQTTRRFTWARMLAHMSSTPFRLPDHLSADAPLIYVNVANTGLEYERSVSRLVQQHGVKAVFFVHDLIPIYYPEYACHNDDLAHERRMRTVLRHAACLLTSSKVVKRDTQRFAEQHGLTQPNIRVAPLGSGMAVHSDVPVLKPREPYFLFVGTTEPRKNHYTLLHVWRQLTERLGTQAPRLLIAGRDGWNNQHVRLMIERSPALRSRVLACGALPDVVLSHLIAGASALLFPSFVEGYGMPIIEALAHRVPVIASDIPVFREIGKGMPDYVPPLDGSHWERLIECYAEPDSPERLSQLRRIHAAQVPSWEGHFAIFEQCLDALASAPRPTAALVPAASGAALLRPHLASN
jgi:glycosyltransferase involved in cell wall biosynthesis